MNRTITVKGIGRLSLKPDQTIVSLTLKSLNKVYDKAMSDAAEHLDRLRAALAEIGFAKDDLKTVNFDVNTQYESERDKNGNYKRLFVGYCVTHALKLEFPFDSKRLSETLGAVAVCVAEPELEVQFSVRDRDAVHTALLESACINARKNAEILAASSGVTLGELLSVDYSWGELHLASPTRYNMEDAVMMKAAASPCSIEVEPDDINVSDSVTFVWLIA